MAPFEGSPPAPEVPAEDQPMIGTDIEILARRELALRATEAIAEVLEVDVTVGALIRLSEAPEATEVRLAAKRALRCIAAIGRADSAVVEAVGERNIYHYVEGVIDYGADEGTYLALMRAFNLTAEETTGLYALRQSIADEANGTLPGFPTLYKALRHIGISPRQAVQDPDGTMTALSDAGCFVDHAGKATFNRPVFLPRGSEHLPPLGRNVDSMYTTRETVETVAWLNEFAANVNSEESER